MAPWGKDPAHAWKGELERVEEPTETGCLRLRKEAGGCRAEVASGVLGHLELSQCGRTCQVPYSPLGGLQCCSGAGHSAYPSMLAFGVPTRP